MTWQSVRVLPLLLECDRNPDQVHSKNFVLWNVLGILDLVLAVTLGGLGPFLFPELQRMQPA